MVMMVLNIGSYGVGDGSDGGNAGDDDDDDYDDDYTAWPRRRVMERPSE